jgi:hypothetical protein
MKWAKTPARPFTAIALGLIAVGGVWLVSEVSAQSALVSPRDNAPGRNGRAGRQNGRDSRTEEGGR